jgi:predicted phage terminase large subunit-like protein
MQVWGVFVVGREYHVMLLDAWRDFLSFPQLVSRVKKEIKTTYGATDEPMFRPLILPKGPPIGHQGKAIDLTIIEDKGSGISLRQQLASENILTHPYNPGREDKLMRLHLVSPLFAHGRVWMVESNVHPGKVRNWAEPVREALCTFRGSGSIEYDDDVDAATQALRYVKDNFMKSLTSEKGSHVVDSDRTRVSSRSQQPGSVNPYAE